MASSEMIYREWRPEMGSRLAPLLDVAWGFEGPTWVSRKRILPTGTVELLINLGEPYLMLEGSGDQSLVTTWLSGVQCAPMVVKQPYRQCLLGLRLRPAGAYALIGDALCELCGQVADLGHFLGQEAERLRQRCLEAPDLDERLRVAVSWFEGRALETGFGDSPWRREVGFVAHRLESSGGSAAIGELRARTGLSKTRLATAFRRHVGVTPKRNARLIRFACATSSLQHGAVSLAEAAHAVGFYDQPHMNAEFRQLAGMTPRQFLAARHAMGDGTTAAELV